MQPRSHAAVIRRAARHRGGLAGEQLEALLAGNDDEDVHIVPLVGWRLRAAGLSHSCHPGSRFGELLAPSAGWRSARLFRRALSAHARDRHGAFVLLGRVCHLIGDAGVPARARGVWHFDGDPFETWLEAHVEAIDDCALPPPMKGPANEPVGALVERLATVAAREKVDTTRTPWGRLRFRRGRGAMVDDALAEEQAARLVPEIVAHTARVLELFEMELRHVA